MSKKIWILAVAAAMAMLLPSQAQAQKGESAFGVQTGYTSTNNSAIAGLFFQYGLSNVVRISPEMGCVLRHQGRDAFTADVNVHFPLRLTPPRADLYPLVGLDFSSWTWHHVGAADDIGGNDVSTRKSRFGVNAGAGFQFNASETLKLKIEAKYTITSQVSTFVLGVGVGYRF